MAYPFFARRLYWPPLKFLLRIYALCWTISWFLIACELGITWTCSKQQTRLGSLCALSDPQASEDPSFWGQRNFTETSTFSELESLLFAPNFLMADAKALKSQRRKALESSFLRHTPLPDLLKDLVDPLATYAAELHGFVLHLCITVDSLSSQVRLSLHYLIALPARLARQPHVQSFFPFLFPFEEVAATLAFNLSFPPWLSSPIWGLHAWKLDMQMGLHSRHFITESLYGLEGLGIRLLELRKIHNAAVQPARDSARMFSSDAEAILATIRKTLVTRLEWQQYIGYKLMGRVPVEMEVVEESLALIARVNTALDGTAAALTDTETHMLQLAGQLRAVNESFSEYIRKEKGIHADRPVQARRKARVEGAAMECDAELGTVQRLWCDVAVYVSFLGGHDVWQTDKFTWRRRLWAAQQGQRKTG